MTTSNDPPISDDELMAFVDGVLDREQHQRIERQLQDDADLAAVIASMRAQRNALQMSLRPVLDEPIPLRLTSIDSPLPRRLRRFAAVFAWLTVGVAVGSIASWQYLSHHYAGGTSAGRNTPDLPRFVHQASVAYAVFAPEQRHPVEIVSTEVTALNSWLSERLGRHTRAPDLTRLGYALIGGRLLPGEINKPAAQFMYQDKQGNRLTVYLRGMAQPTPGTAFQYAEQGEISTFYWVERNWGYALSGELSRPQLLLAAREIYAQLAVARHEG